MSFCLHTSDTRCPNCSQAWQPVVGDYSYSYFGVDYSQQLQRIEALLTEIRDALRPKQNPADTDVVLVAYEKEQQ